MVLLGGSGWSLKSLSGVSSDVVSSSGSTCVASDDIESPDLDVPVSLPKYGSVGESVGLMSESAEGGALSSSRLGSAVERSETSESGSVGDVDDGAARLDVASSPGTDASIAST